MLRLLLVASALCLTILVLLFGARLVGTLYQPSSALRDYQCTPQPCWHGIYPETTSIEDAPTIIASDQTLRIDKQVSDGHFSRVCWVSPSSSQESGCLFSSGDSSYLATSFPESPFRNGPLTFADTVNLFGAPMGVQVCRDMMNEHQLFVTLYFRGAVLVSGKPFDLSELTDRIELDTPIDEIDYHFSPTSAMSEWKGFASISDIRYC